MEFKAFRKIARWSRDIVITEKLDGTNAQIYISEDDQFLTGSRTRWITPEDDNYGFSRWAHANKDELMKLGKGQHFGEWWGQGIQRNYSMPEKRFSLFNTSRWLDDAVRPACCYVVPLLYAGANEQSAVHKAIVNLDKEGSQAAPGFMDAEGIVIYHAHSNQLFKKTLKKDDKHKFEV